MDTLKDLWASLVAGIRDRTTNPLTISFVISWCLWNFKFFVVLFGDGTAAERLDAIAAMYPHEQSTYYGNALLYPIASALAYVFVYPVVSLAAIGAYRTYQVWTANLVKRVEKSRVLSKADATELTRIHEREKTALEEQLASLSIQVASLRRALSEAEDQASKANAEVPAKVMSTASPSTPGSLELPKPGPDAAFKLPPTAEGTTGNTTLSGTERALLLKLSEWSQSVRAKSIADAMDRNYSLVDANLKSLKEKGLAEDSGSGWVLTQSGRTLAVKLLSAT